MDPSFDYPKPVKPTSLMNNISKNKFVYHIQDCTYACLILKLSTMGPYMISPFPNLLVLYIYIYIYIYIIEIFSLFKELGTDLLNYVIIFLEDRK